MNKTKVTVAVATILLSVTGLSYGAGTTVTTVSNTPLSQSTISVDKNLVRDADNKGLNNASTRLETNQDRLEARKAVRSAKRADAVKRADKITDKAEVKQEQAVRAEKALRVEKAVRVEKAERIEKAERPEKVERPEKIERPEKVERPEKIERPEVSGPGR